VTDELSPELLPAAVPLLAQVLASEAPAPVRALAAIRLRRATDLELVRVLDGCVGSVAPAGDVPESYFGQVHDVCPEGWPMLRGSLEWTRPLLGEVCLVTAEHLTSRYRTLQEYRVWRRQHPDPRDSYELWEDLLDDGTLRRQEALTELERHSPALLVRVVLSHRGGLEALGLTPSFVAEHGAGAVPAAELLARLQAPEAWPELSDSERRAAFLHNLLRGWRDLLGPDGPTRLGELWDQGFGVADPHTRAVLARAVAEAVPARRAAVVQAGLALPPTVASPPLLELLAVEPVGTAPAVLARWYGLPVSDAAPEWLVVQCREAILVGLARATPPPRGLFRSLLLPLTPADEELLPVAAETAGALGAALPAGACADLSPHLGKGGVDRSATEVARATRAREGCLAALRRSTAAW